MTEMKEIQKFVFTVEGETEKWYLDWLQKQINAYPFAKYRAMITSKVEQNPLKFAKSQTARSNPQIIHLCDVEGQTVDDTQKFRGTLDQLHEAKKLGKKIRYSLGYSNLTFELWMILHKSECSRAFSDRTQYLAPLNYAYSQKFESLKQYKEERNFGLCLSQLSLKDVFIAIERAERIMENNKEVGKKLINYKGFSYYDNPSLSIFEAVKSILQTCGITK